MTATVNITQLSPETLAEPQGSTALVVNEPKNRPSYTEAEMRARSILSRIESLSAKLKTLENDIRLLWIDFDNLKAGETILGCATKKEFCEKKLNRTPRAIQYLLAGQSNPADRPRSELSSPLDPVYPPQTTVAPKQPIAAENPEAYDQLRASISERILARDQAKAGKVSMAEAKHATQPAPEPEKQPSQTAELRKWFTARYEAFSLSPTKAGGYDLTLHNLAPAQVKAIGEWLASQEPQS